MFLRCVRVRIMTQSLYAQYQSQQQKTHTMILENTRSFLHAVFLWLREYPLNAQYLPTDTILTALSDLLNEILKSPLYVTCEIMIR